MAKKDKPSREKKKPKKAKAARKAPAKRTEPDDDSNPGNGHEVEGSPDEENEDGGNAKKAKGHLPDKKNAPKRTGQRGIKPPLDPVEDFEKPVKTGEEAVAELDKPKAKGSLLADNPPKPTVANGRMKVFYDKPFTTKVKDKILIALACTVVLEKEHDELLPKIIADAHRDMRKGRTRINLTDIPAQSVSFFLESTTPADEALIEIEACRMINTNLAIVQRKGEGSTRSVVRLSFRLQTVREAHLVEWASLNLANDHWIELSESQGTLWDDEDDEK